MVEPWPYFPEVFPGELVYSILARLRRHTGSISERIFLKSFYCEAIPGHNVALPTRMAMLADRIPSKRGLTALKLIEENTLFSYYARYADPQNRRAAFQNMLGSMGMAQKRLRISYTIPTPIALRFCPECQTAMMKDYGELYWRREHLLPGVLICPLHGCNLRNSNVHLGRHVTKLLAATQVTCPASCEFALPPTSQADRIKLRSLASDSIDILEGRDRFAIASEDVFKVYRHRLAEKGQMSVGRLRVATGEYSRSVRLETGYLKPIWPRLFTEDGDCASWLKSLSHGNGVQDTTYIILGLRAVEALQKGGSKRDNRIAQFGTGPWQCRNPLSGHFGDMTITEPAVRLKGGRLAARFSCHCGFEYIQSLDVNGVLKTPCLYRYGETLRPLVLQALASGWTAGLTAKRAGITTPALIHHARMLGIETPWVLGKMRKPRAPPAKRKRSRVRTLTLR